MIVLMAWMTLGSTQVIILGGRDNNDSTNGLDDTRVNTGDSTWWQR